jgi:hypothetical protein
MFVAELYSISNGAFLFGHHEHWQLPLHDGHEGFELQVAIEVLARAFFHGLCVMACSLQ